jgi:hypothetical protein
LDRPSTAITHALLALLAIITTKFAMLKTALKQQAPKAKVMEYLITHLRSLLVAPVRKLGDNLPRRVQPGGLLPLLLAPP